MQGLALARTPHEQDLLNATGCSLRLYQLRHDDALGFADNQLSLRETVMARSNRAVACIGLAAFRKLFPTRNEPFVFT